MTPSMSHGESVTCERAGRGFVAFDGVQPIDVVGPHEVFASARDAAASLGSRWCARAPSSPPPQGCWMGAGIDLALALVADDLGADIAQTLARTA